MSLLIHDNGLSLPSPTQIRQTQAGRAQVMDSGHLRAGRVHQVICSHPAHQVGLNKVLFVPAVCVDSVSSFGSRTAPFPSDD